MNFKANFFEELTTSELYEIARARTEIFLLEQKIICQDFDGIDYTSLHCFIEDDGKVLAYLRAFLAEDNTVRIGRVLSIKHGIGLGKTLMEKSIPEINKKFGTFDITLHAQEYAAGFYKKFGFVPYSVPFMEEGIVHISMILKKII